MVGSGRLLNYYRSNEYLPLLNQSVRELALAIISIEPYMSVGRPKLFARSFAEPSGTIPSGGT